MATRYIPILLSCAVFVCFISISSGTGNFSYFNNVFNPQGEFSQQTKVLQLLAPFLRSSNFTQWAEQLSRGSLLTRAIQIAKNSTTLSSTIQNAIKNGLQNFIRSSLENIVKNGIQSLLQNRTLGTILQNENVRNLIQSLATFGSSFGNSSQTVNPVRNVLENIGPVLTTLTNAIQSGKNGTNLLDRIRPVLSILGNISQDIRKVNGSAAGMSSIVNNIVSSLTNNADINDGLNAVFQSLTSGPVSGLDANALSSLLSGNFNAETATSLLMSAVQQSIQSFNISDVCKSDVTRYVQGLANQQGWALKMLDASAKIPTDLLNLNLNWYGSYDECNNDELILYEMLPSTLSAVRGQYCNVHVRLPLPPELQLALLFTGGDGSIRMGMCLPKSCSVTDLYILVNGALASVPLGNASVTAYPIDCPVTAEDMPYTKADIAMIIVCGIFVVLMALGTLYDFVDIQLPKCRQRRALQEVERDGSESGSAYKLRTEVDEKAPDVKVDTEPQKKLETSLFVKILMCFSVYTNGKKILNTFQPKGTLTAVNGIRFLSMSWVILGHTLSFILGYTSNFMTYYADFMKRWETMAITNALVAVDTFFVLSGLLTSYLLLKQLKKSKGRINWFLFYFHRFWRLTPVYMLVIGLYMTVIHHMIFGPNKLARDQACANYWWWNLLYISNFKEKVSDICLGWSWYLNNDMQFYVISPLMLVPLFFIDIVGIIICFALLLGVTITTGVLSSENGWSPHVAGGGEADSNDMTAMFNEYYIKPYTRMGPYICGIITGYLLYKKKCKCRINAILNLCIWGIATAVALAVLYGLYNAFNGHPLTKEVSALYNAMNRTAWGAAVCWVIFACATGNGGFVNTLLSWDAFVPLSRLTYCAYLIHPVIIFIYYAGHKFPFYVTDLDLVYYFLANLVMSYGIAFVLSLAFESPFMGLEKIIFGGKRKRD